MPLAGLQTSQCPSRELRDPFVPLQSRSRATGISYLFGYMWVAGTVHLGEVWSSPFPERFLQLEEILQSHGEFTFSPMSLWSRSGFRGHPSASELHSSHCPPPPRGWQLEFPPLGMGAPSGLVGDGEWPRLCHSGGGPPCTESRAGVLVTHVAWGAQSISREPALGAESHRSLGGCVSV